MVICRQMENFIFRLIVLNKLLLSKNRKSKDFQRPSGIFFLKKERGNLQIVLHTIELINRVQCYVQHAYNIVHYILLTYYSRRQGEYEKIIFA